MKKVLTGFVLASLLGLVACTNIDWQQPRTQLNAGLQGTGAKLIQQGDQLRVVMPTATSFHPGSSHLTPQMTRVLAQVTNTLKKYPDLKVKVIGYTDNHGSPRTNQLISLRRALMVADYFRNHGISSLRISATGLGEANPIADNNTANGRAWNRRVEVVLVAG